MKLHQHLGRRLGLATAGVLLLFLVLAVSQAVLSINRERSAVVHLLELSAQIEALQTVKGPEFDSRLKDIIALSREGDFRHIEILVTNREGKLLAASDPLRDANPAGLRLGRWMQSFSGESPDATFTRIWQLGEVNLAIRPSLASEQSEAGTNLLISLLMLAGFSLVLFIGMKWVLARALHPLNDSIHQLQQLARNQYGGKLNHSPVDELQRINFAINDLSHALAALEASRKMLSAKLISSQEDERAHISRELHDEFGQKLTIIRFNADYLQRSFTGQPEVRQALHDVQQAANDIHGELRNLLARLRPAPERTRMSNADLSALLGKMVTQWSQSPAQNTRFEHHLELGDAPLDSSILLTLFRITQEALTNIAKHAQASHVVVRIVREGQTLHWSVTDDGRGLEQGLPEAMLRGNGLAGLQQRLWALGGELRVCNASLQSADPENSNVRPHGTELIARIPC